MQLQIKYGISYGRVSTFDQAFNEDGTKKDDASPKMQKFRCQQYVDSLNMRGDNKVTFSLVEHISDDGVSAKNTKREGYQKLISHIKSGKINFIVATELSRLSRNSLDFLEFSALCERYKVDVMIIGLNLDTSSAFGKAMATVLVSLAQFERETTSERVKKNSKARLISDGKINGTSEVLGLDKHLEKKGHFIINNKEVERLEKILKIFLSTASKIDTFREIQRLDIKWKRNETFTKSHFNSMLNAIEYRYRGVWPLNKGDNEEEIQLVKLPHGPVVDSKLLNQVEDRLNFIKGRKRKVGKGYTYLLSTLLVHEDGSKFTGQPARQRQYRYYYNKQHDLRVRCDEIDDLINKRLNDYLSNDEHFQKLILKSISQRSLEVPKINEQIKDLEKSLKEISKQESGIKDKLMITTDMTNEVVLKWFEEQIISFSTQKKDVGDRLKNLEAIKGELLRPIPIEHIKDSIKMFLGQFKKLPNLNKRAILEKIFEKIVIKGSEVIELHIFDDVFKGENWNLGKKKAVSSTYGLNGGSTGT